jgi:PAS domain S-box-containing protein
MANVLIVDDEASIRTTLSAMLSREGHDVRAAVDGAQALDLLATRPADVIVSDIVLPRQSGVALLREIRQRHPNVQVIMITGEPDVNTAAEAVRQGAFDYLAKPVTREAICRVVANAAGTKRLIDQKTALEEANRKYREELEGLVEKRSAELAESERKYRLLAEHAVDVIWQTDLRLQFTYVSPSIVQLTGHTVEEWLGSNLRDHATQAEYRKMARQTVRAAKTARGRNSSIFEAVIVRKDGTSVPVEVVGRLMMSDHGLPVGFQGAARDISERKAADARIERLHAHQVRINRLAFEIGSTTDMDRIHRLVDQAVRELMDVSAFMISSYDPKTSLIRAEYAVKVDGTIVDVQALPPLPLAATGGNQSTVIRDGVVVNVPDYRASRRGGKKEYTVDQHGHVTEGPPPPEETEVTRSALLVPMRVSGKVIGVMQVQSTRLQAYDQEDESVLSGLANVAAVALSNASLVTQIREAFAGTIRAVGQTMAFRDPYTARHQRNVAHLACAIGEACGLDADRLEGLRVAALVHDLGKIAIPAEILSKPTTLSVIEFSMIKEHPRIGHDLLADVSFPWPVAQIILQHHERIDGSGYPNGLEGNAILPEAQILGVADVVEAMASHRPYRPALGIEAALSEIQDNRGTRYEASYVDACVRVFEDKDFAFDEPPSSPPDT